MKSSFLVSLCNGITITVLFNSRMMADQTVSTFQNQTDLGRPHGAIAIAIFMTTNWLYWS